VVNRATVRASTEDPAPANNTATASTAVTRLADVAVAVSTDASSVVPGGRLIYHVTVANAGPSTATDPRLTLVLPPGVTVEASGIDLPGLDCAVATEGGASVVTCAPSPGATDGGALAPGSRIEGRIVVVLSAEAHGDLRVIADINTDTPQTNYANDHGEVSVRIGEPNPTAGASSTPSPTASPTGGPEPRPTVSPSAEPSPTAGPTARPTSSPTDSSSARPAPQPTGGPMPKMPSLSPSGSSWTLAGMIGATVGAVVLIGLGVALIVAWRRRSGG